MKINASKFLGDLIPVFFNKEDNYCKGRRAMLGTGILNGLAANFSGGVFYTGFLIANHIDITRIGIISFIPFIASLFSLISPTILERFEKRKWILFWGRIAYYIVNILGVTLLPFLVSSDNGRLIGFALIVFVANAINFTFNPGYSVWHIHFLPERIRAQYFTLYQLIVNAIVQAVIFFSGMIADAATGTPEEMSILVIFRIIAMVFAVLDCIVLLRPEEFKYEHSSDKIHFTDVLTKPFRNKLFLKTMLLYYLHVFGANLSGGVINTYLLQTVHVSYSMITGINAVYFLFFMFFGRFWRDLIARFGWIKTMGISYLIGVPVWFLYAFITPGNQIWVFPTVRLVQHFMSAGFAIITSNLLYLNMPKEDRTNYISFHTIFYNVTVLISMMLGTYIVSVMGDGRLNLLFYQFDSVQFLKFVDAIFVVIPMIFCFLWAKKLEPREEY